MRAATRCRRVWRRFAFTDDPDHKVDGTVEYRPKIDQVALWSSPQQGDTYGRGETIEVRINFDDDVHITGPVAPLRPSS